MPSRGTITGAWGACPCFSGACPCSSGDAPEVDCIACITIFGKFVRVSVFIAIGLTVTSIVAVALAYSHANSRKALEVSYTRVYTSDDASWTIVAGAAWGQFGLVSASMPHRRSRVADVSERPSQRLPRWSGLDDVRGGGDVTLMLHEFGFGWPLICLVRRVGPGPPQAYQTTAAQRGSWIPNDVYFPGLVCDCLFFGLISWGLVTALRRTNSWLRRRRGLCIECGYSLVKSPAMCPECGRRS